MMEMSFDWVITIGDRALEETPQFSSNPQLIHWPVNDPANADGAPDQQTVFRKALADIESRLPELYALVTGPHPTSQAQR